MNAPEGDRDDIPWNGRWNGKGPSGNPRVLVGDIGKLGLSLTPFIKIILYG